MQTSSMTARQLYEALKTNPTRQRQGFKARLALINVDVQNAYTAVGRYKTAYETDPRQIEYINQLSGLFRDHACPVVWTYVAYLESGEDCGVWGLRSNTPDSLQNIKTGSDCAALDERVRTDPARDVILQKRMASAFFETSLGSLLTFHGVNTLVITGGSTSGCVRSTVVDGLSRGFRIVVPEECVADKHESPHFASLYDMSLKYADVIPLAEVITGVEQCMTAAAQAQSRLGIGKPA